MVKTLGKLVFSSLSVTFAACELVASVKCVNDATDELKAHFAPQPEPEPKGFWERAKKGKKKKDKKK